MVDERSVYAAENFPAETPAGLWKVHVESAQYRAWEFWLAKEFRKEFFPKPVMVVWNEWPPTSWEGARDVGLAIAAIRDGEDPYAFRRPDGKRRPMGGKPVPESPEPWGGCVPPAPPRGQYADNLADKRRAIVAKYLGT